MQNKNEPTNVETSFCASISAHRELINEVLPSINQSRSKLRSSLYSECPAMQLTSHDSAGLRVNSLVTGMSQDSLSENIHLHFLDVTSSLKAIDIERAAGDIIPRDIGTLQRKP